MAWTQSSTSLPLNICMRLTEEIGGGAYGFNNYCILGNDQRSNYYCPNGYSFIDSSDEMKGCK